jgi:protein-L-isoaspartate(D-aspartate) O-methyltransferase
MISALLRRRESRPNYVKERELMVKTQLIPRGIKSERVLQAMMEVPRHLFVPEELREVAYQDCPLPIGCGQTISQPYIVALMTEALELGGDEKVLEIGTGSGYQAAILSLLAKDVYTIERIAALAEGAERVLKELGYTNVMVKVGDGTLGWEEYAPFDAIIITAAAPNVPQPLIEQLGDGGRLVAPIGPIWSQLLVKVRRKGKDLIVEHLTAVAFVPLIGEYGWEK